MALYQAVSAAIMFILPRFAGILAAVAKTGDGQSHNLYTSPAFLLVIAVVAIFCYL